MRRRLLALTLPTLVCAMPLNAQQSAQLTLSEAVNRALHHDPSIELAAANYERARSFVREVAAARQPSLHLDVSAMRYAEPMIVAPLHGFALNDVPTFNRTLTQSSANLGYTIFDAARGPRIDRAQALALSARSVDRSARMQLLSDVSRQYFQLRSARELVEASASRLKALEREHARAAQLVEQGKAARVVLLRADAALSAAKAENVSAAGDVEVATNALARQIDMDADSLRAFVLRTVRSKTPSPLDAAALRALARDSNPDLDRARRQLSAAEAGRGEARAALLPRLQLGGRAIQYGSTETSPQVEWQGGVQLSYPLFTGGARGAAIDRAVADINVARAEYALAARGVDQAVDRAVSAVNTARARTEALEAAATQSEEVTRIERLALDAGAGVQTDYLSAEADLFRARAALTDARAAELIALIELARITGQLSEQWLSDNVEPHQ